MLPDLGITPEVKAYLDKFGATSFADLAAKPATPKKNRREGVFSNVLMGYDSNYVLHNRPGR